MNENLPSNIQLDASENGTVVFATDVIATIAGLAATEVEGVVSMVGSSGGLADIFTRKGQSTKNLTKGVRIDLGENNTVSVQLTVVVDYGSPIPEVAKNIQENVKKAIETMSGLTVSAVNVHVPAMSFEREKNSAAEIEQQQRLMLQKQAEEKQTEEKPAEAAPEATAPADDIDPDDGFYELELEDVPEEEIIAEAAQAVDQAAQEAAAETAEPTEEAE